MANAILESMKNLGKKTLQEGKQIMSANNAVQHQALYAAGRYGQVANDVKTAQDITDKALKNMGAHADDIAAAQKHVVENGGDLRQVLAEKSMARQEMLQNAANSGKFTETAGAVINSEGLGGIAGMAKQYYTGEGLAKSAARIGATYAGLSIGHRVVTGGGLTTTAEGERDIAGIPFI